MPESNLGRLFAYAKASNARPVENFTTEALAAAIRSDPAPILRPLEALGISISGPLVVATQVRIAGGQMDLLLRGDGEVCVEVKIDAEETPGQLATYEKWKVAGSNRHVVVLARAPLRGAEVPFLPWQQVWNEARNGNLYWEDLRRWLEDVGMANDSDEPIESQDLCGVAGLQRLIRKLCAVLASAAPTLRGSWARCPAEDQIPSLVWSRFQRLSSPSIEIPLGDHSGISLGLVDATTQRGTEEIHLGIWLWAHPSKGDDARRLGQASRALDPGTWLMGTNAWEITRALHIATGTKDAAVSWLVARAAELHRVVG